MSHPLPTPTSTPTQAPDFKITHLTTPPSISIHQPQLSKLLQDVVNEGSSIGFLAPLSIDEADTYWTQVSSLVAQGNLHLFILTSSSPLSSISDATEQENGPRGEILGTVQLVTIPKTTHLHRAEVIKLLVAPEARRQGIARMLMEYVEGFARGTGREVLTLDTATGSAAVEMYRRLGWEEWGTCKRYASWADGSRCDATFFRKEI